MVLLVGMQFFIMERKNRLFQLGVIIVSTMASPKVLVNKTFLFKKTFSSLFDENDIE